MSEQVAFIHLGYVLTIQSHEVPKGGWEATVTIEQLEGGKTNAHRFTWDWTHPLATRNAAIAGAKQQDIIWVDSHSFPEPHVMRYAAKSCR